MLRAYLGLGSNLGDREGRLAAARRALAALPEASLGRTSPLYETEPWGDPDQPWYCNQVVALELGPGWSARRLLRAVQAIEAGQGRTRDPARRFGPRTLDIDILLYGQEKIVEPDCVIPHPRMRERAFVLVPLADIAPDGLIPTRDGTESVKQALSKIAFKISGNVITVNQ